MKKFVAFSIFLLFAVPAWAQSSVPALGSNSSGRSQTSTLGSDAGSLDIFSLVHKANLANSKSSKEFRDESAKEMDDVVAKFRNRKPLQITPAGMQIQATPASNVVEVPKP
jgi:hypothetical protein